MFVNDDHLSDMTENEKRKEGNDLMTCFVIHVSLLPFWRNTVEGRASPDLQAA